MSAWIMAALLGFATPIVEADAAPTSRDVASWCRRADATPEATRCLDYIYAVANHVDQSRIAKGLPQCVPPRVDGRQLRKLVARRLVTRADLGAGSPVQLVAFALIEAFDCTSDRRGRGTPHRLPGSLVPAF